MITIPIKDEAAAAVARAIGDEANPIEIRIEGEYPMHGAYLYEPGEPPMFLGPIAINADTEQRRQILFSLQRWWQQQQEMAAALFAQLDYGAEFPSEEAENATRAMVLVAGTPSKPAADALERQAVPSWLPTDEEINLLQQALQNYAAGMPRTDYHRALSAKLIVLSDKLASSPPAPAPAQPDPNTRVPDGVWEALQRMIEDGLRGGPASQDDARSVARWRARFVPARDGATAAQPTCKCGQPWVLNTIHREHSPCWRAADPVDGLGPQPGVVRICPERDRECGDNSRKWCLSCPKLARGHA